MSIANREKWKNLDALVLENEAIRAVVLPQLGAKTASILYKKTGFEAVAQSRDSEYRLPGTDEAFSKYDASGFDDAFPSIEPSSVRLNGEVVNYPDHGELWSSPFGSEVQDDRLCFSFESKRFPYRYQKQVSLAGDTVAYDYRITGLRDYPFPCLWAFHGLVRYEEDMELYYPDNIKGFVNVIESPELGPAERIYDTESERYNFFAVPPRSSNTMVKYYVLGRVEKGECGYRYPSRNMDLRITYDPQKLPYLGFWVTAGGFRGDYNCALEPANGYYDGIATARKNRSLYVLEPYATLDFSLRVRLKELDQSTEAI